MGLLGNYDDIETNDFQTPGGDVISHDASLQDIHYMFGIHCKSTLHRFPRGGGGHNIWEYVIGSYVSAIYLWIKTYYKIKKLNIIQLFSLNMSNMKP